MPRGLLLQSIYGIFNGLPQKLRAGTPVASDIGSALPGDVVIGSAYNANLIEGSATPTVTVPTGTDSVS
jgi:hypothetical protein